VPQPLSPDPHCQSKSHFAGTQQNPLTQAPEAHAQSDGHVLQFSPGPQT
jgi:hypothetical protein